MNKELSSNEIIDALGGTAATALLCQVKDPSVSEWRKSGIPSARLMFIKLARPDLFGALDARAGVVPRRATDPAAPPAPSHTRRPPKVPA